MSISREEWVRRYGHEFAPYYQEYDSDIKPQHNFRILTEMNASCSSRSESLFLNSPIVFAFISSVIISTLCFLGVFLSEGYKVALRGFPVFSLLFLAIFVIFFLTFLSIRHDQRAKRFPF